MIVGAIQTVVEGRSLSRDTARAVMEAILTGGVTPAQFGALVTALRLKGESADEIAGFLESMRAHATRVELGELPAVDACGTGGRGVSWFNVTTTAALIAAGRAIKRAIMATQRIEHPAGDSDLNFLYGTIFTELRPAGSEVHSRNACVFAEGELDRSPTGTGVSSRAALYHARGELAAGETLQIESLIGTRFSVRIVKRARVGALPAVIPEVTGSASITGIHDFLIDPADPLREGFLLR